MTADYLDQKILEYVYENTRDHYMLIANDGTILQSTCTSGLSASNQEALNLIDWCADNDAKDILRSHLKQVPFNEIPVNLQIPGQNRHLYYISGRPSYTGNGIYHYFLYLRSMEYYQTTEDLNKHLEDYLTTILQIHDGYITIFDTESLCLLRANTQYINYMRLILETEFYPGIPLEKAVSKSGYALWREHLIKCVTDSPIRFSYTNPLGQTLGVTMMAFNNRSEIIVLSKNITKEEKYRQELIEMNQNLETKVALRNTQLQESYDNLSLFNQVITHEMKTPIREINSYAGFLLEDNSDILSPESLEDLTSIRRICQEVIDCINEFVIFSKVTYTEMKNEPISMKNLVYSVIEELSVIPNTSPVSYIVYDLPGLNCDPLMMKVVYRNILHNSIKFSMKDHVNTITCGYMVDKDYVTYYVNDRGVGFHSNAPAKVFDMFERAHSNTEYEGSGIGLSTVKAIVKRNNGEVDILSEENHGCTIFLKFPIRQCTLQR